MNIRTGVDLIEVHRIEDAFQRHGERFLHRIYTPVELADVGGHFPSLAARFAAKEAVAKAFCTGIGPMKFTEIEIRKGKSGEPILQLHGNALKIANEQGLSSWSISLSHTRFHAVAMVVAISDK